MRVIFFFAALALVLGFAFASNVDDLTNIMASLDDNLSSDDLNVLEDVDFLAMGMTSTYTGIGTGIIGDGPGTNAPIRAADMAVGMGGVVQVGPITLKPASATLMPTKGAAGVTAETAASQQCAAGTPCVYFVYHEYAGIYEGSSDYVNIHVAVSEVPTAPIVVPITCAGDPTQRISVRLACPVSLTIPANQGKDFIFTLSFFDNHLVDMDATFNIALSSYAGAKLGISYHTEVSVHDDDGVVNAAAPVYTRCNIFLPRSITLSGFGDTLANQVYGISGAKGNYYCTYTGKTNASFAVGIRNVLASDAWGNWNQFGIPHRWQVWANFGNTVNGGTIRYQSLSIDVDISGLVTYWSVWNGFNPAGKVTAGTDESDATKYHCLSVWGADNNFDGYYEWEDTNNDRLIRLRNLGMRSKVIVATPATTTDWNTGYWYFAEDNKTYNAYYKSVNRGGLPTGKYVSAFSCDNDVNCDETMVPVVNVAPWATCAAMIAPRLCVVASGSTYDRVNQIYERFARGTDPRYTFFAGLTYPAFGFSRLSSNADSAKNGEFWADHWFLSMHGNTILYANKKGSAINTNYYSVNAGVAGTVMVQQITCPRK